MMRLNCIFINADECMISCVNLIQTGPASCPGHLFDTSGISSLLDCDELSVVKFDDRHDIYYDKKSGLDISNRFFMQVNAQWLGSSGLLPGRVVIIGRDPENGLMEDHSLDLIDVQKKIRFLTRENAREFIQKINNDRAVVSQAEVDKMNLGLDDNGWEK